MTELASRTPSILVADTQPDAVSSLVLYLQGERYEFETAGSAEAVVQALRVRSYDAALVEIGLLRKSSEPGAAGLLERIRVIDSTLPVIATTPMGSTDLAVEAIRNGAGDFIQKPWEPIRLHTVLRTQIELCRALRKASLLESENRELRAGIERMAKR